MKLYKLKGQTLTLDNLVEAAEHVIPWVDDEALIRGDDIWQCCWCATCGNLVRYGYAVSLDDSELAQWATALMIAGEQQ